MHDIVVIAPFESMVEVTRRVISENDFNNVEILEGNRREGVEAAKRAIDAGAKVVISRGGTYELIKAELDIPIVEVKVTAFDLIDSFKLVKETGDSGTIGVIGYRNVISGANIVAEVMGLKAVCVEMTEKYEISEHVENMIRQGIRIFVGDANVVDAVEKYNCRVILVKSGAQAMQHAIQNANNILYASRLEKEKAQQFATIIDFVHDGVIAIDNLGFITVFNSASENITGHARQAVLGRKITEVISESRLLNVLKTKCPEIGEIQTLDNQTVIATNRVPVIVDGEVRGAVATYQDITEVQKLEQKFRIRIAEKGFLAQHNFTSIVHKSAEISECIKVAKKFAKYDTSVLICGPSGVGKELFAQSIHNSSPRKSSPFVAINCAALPENLIESELFGYVEGAFTGAARKGKVGLFEMAHGGTIFLDEISELPLLLQGRMLRVLQEKQIMRIGDNKLIPVDVRIICATNRDLRSLVSQNQFRGDLYFRIAILSLFIPPLDERVADIDLLSTSFLDEFCFRYRKGLMTLTPDAIAYLRSHEFSGNVRELQGMIERAVVVCDGNLIGSADLIDSRSAMSCRRPDMCRSFFAEGQTLKGLEEEYIEYVYKKTNGSIKECSAILGIDRTTLWRRIKEKQWSRDY